MKSKLLLMGIMVAVACGGADKKTTKRPLLDDALELDEDPVREEERESEPPPPPPQKRRAEVTLEAVKGSKLTPATITFEQRGRGDIAITSEQSLDGLKAGKYHLVVHEGDDCGKNAAGAGEERMALLTFDVSKGSDANIDDEVSVDDSIVGYTLVLHADKKGKPGKPLACGEIMGESFD